MPPESGRTLNRRSLARARTLAVDHQDDNENVMHSVLLLVTDPEGSRREVAMATTSHPSTWSADTARAFLHDGQRAIGAHGIYRISFDPGIPGPLSVLTDEADTATATVTLLGLSEDGRVALERIAFEVP
jgi:hypothetical protein